MPNPLTLSLQPLQRQELERLRDTSSLPYLRERAAGLLKLAAGQSREHIARHGLHKPRHPDTLSRWFHAYQTDTVEGLRIKPGRGRKPAFSPSVS